MKFLIDGNVILDVLQNREPYVTDSLAVWNMCEEGKIIGYISSLTFANIVYILRKELNAEKIENLYHSLAKIFRIVDFRATDAAEAASLRWKDYEDAVQTMTASRLNLDAIITRNIADFSSSLIPAITPEEVVNADMADVGGADNE